MLGQKAGARSGVRHAQVVFADEAGIALAGGPVRIAVRAAARAPLRAVEFDAGVALEHTAPVVDAGGAGRIGHGDARRGVDLDEARQALAHRARAVDAGRLGVRDQPLAGEPAKATVLDRVVHAGGREVLVDDPVAVVVQVVAHVGPRLGRHASPGIAVAHPGPAAHGVFPHGLAGLRRRNRPFVNERVAVVVQPIARLGRGSGRITGAPGGIDPADHLPEAGPVLILDAAQLGHTRALRQTIAGAADRNALGRAVHVLTAVPVGAGRAVDRALRTAATTERALVERDTEIARHDAVAVGLARQAEAAAQGQARAARLVEPGQTRLDDTGGGPVDGGTRGHGVGHRARLSAPSTVLLMHDQPGVGIDEVLIDLAVTVVVDEIARLDLGLGRGTVPTANPGAGPRSVTRPEFVDRRAGIVGQRGRVVGHSVAVVIHAVALLGGGLQGRTLAPPASPQTTLGAEALPELVLPSAGPLLAQIVHRARTPPALRHTLRGGTGRIDLGGHGLAHEPVRTRIPETARPGARVAVGQLDAQPLTALHVRKTRLAQRIRGRHTHERQIGPGVLDPDTAPALLGALVDAQDRAHRPLVAADAPPGRAVGTARARSPEVPLVPDVRLRAIEARPIRNGRVVGIADFRGVGHVQRGIAVRRLVRARTEQTNDAHDPNDSHQNLLVEAAPRPRWMVAKSQYRSRVAGTPDE